MTKQADKQTLVNKLREIVAELGPIQKKGRHPQYAYTTASQVLAELRHRLSDRGIYLQTTLLSKQIVYDAGGKGVYAEVETEHTFHDTENGEQLTVKSGGHGWDMGDKGIYKARTGALKNMLMDNFLITDENEPEAGEQAESHPPDSHPSEDKPRGVEPHRRMKPYEEATGEGDKKVATDLLELKAWLTQHKIPDGFLLRLLEEKKMADGHTKNVAQIKPGILRRLLAPKTLENLLAAWKQQQSDEDTGSQTPPYSKGIQNEEGDASKDQPEQSLDDGPVVNPKKAKLVKKEPEPKTEVRTNEGDQTRGSRQQVDDGTDPDDLLEQEGYDNWREVEIHFGQHKGKLLGKLPQKSLAWWVNNWTPKPYRGTWDEKDLVLDAALVLAGKELGGAE